MKECFFRLICAAILVATVGLVCHGQGGGGARSSLSGVVFDTSGGVIPGADVSLKKDATGIEFKVVATEDGTFSIPSLDAGTYTATVSMTGFKKAIVKDIKLVAGMPAWIKVTLEVGSSDETTTMRANTEIVQSQSANVASTLNSQQILQTPMVSRNVMDFLVFLPGVNTTSSNRGSTINGLQQSAINITLDGINTQDNFNKDSDGFSSMITMRMDAVEEVTLSSATPGAESASQGAVQIKFVTRSGSNHYHGNLYEYHRNPTFQSNNWFTNRDAAPDWGNSTDPCTPQQLVSDFSNCKAPRSRILLNQPGGSIGGPIILPKKIFGPLGFNGKNRAFFFANYEEFHLPSQQARTRTVLNPNELTNGSPNGTFNYLVGSTVLNVNLLNLPYGNTVGAATIDPTIGQLLKDINTATTRSGTLQSYAPNPEYYLYNFQNKPLNVQKKLTMRGDFNVTDKQHLEVVWYFNRYLPVMDTSRNADPAFPGFPNVGYESSNRATLTTALRSTLKPGLINELRFGLQAGVSLLEPNINSGQFQAPTGQLGNEDGYALNLGSAGLSSAYVYDATSRLNSLPKTIEDTLSWTHGAHNVSAGGTYSYVGLFSWSQTPVPTVSFGVDSGSDPARTMFDATNGPKNFPGATVTQYTAAQSLYAVLTGRVTQISGNGVLSETTNQYKYNGAQVARGHQTEVGLFLQDSWRVRPNFTFNYGARWELQMPYAPGNSVYTYNTVDDLWGISGHQDYGNGNLYKPGPTTLSPPSYKQYTTGTPAYNTQHHNFAPSMGFAWTPDAGGFLSKILGESGGSVFRGGFSLAYVRMSTGEFAGIYGSNPGLTINATRNMSNGNLLSTKTPALPLFLHTPGTNTLGDVGPPSFAATPVYPLQSTSISDYVTLFDPHLKTPYVMSWTFGWQRRLGKDTVVEARYVANKNLQPWTERNLNEINIVENGFLNEFKLAMANLQANINAGRGNTFKYAGPNTSTSPLPITLAYFSGLSSTFTNDTSKYNSPNFTSNTYLTYLAKQNPNPVGFATSMYAGSSALTTYRQNALNANLPANEFYVNPTIASGCACFETNGGLSWYNSLQVELRRRLAKGLLLQGSYVFAKELDTIQRSFRDPYIKTIGQALPHAIKVTWIYELPFGRGRTYLGNSHGIVDGIIGGWAIQGAGRLQSGALLNFGNVQLVGMTPDQLRSQIGLRFDNANKLVYYEPANIIKNTIAAYNVSATNIGPYGNGGFSTTGVPTGQYIAPANQPVSGQTTNCIQVVAGDCQPYALYIRGPWFQRLDVSMVKKIRFTETKNLELRGEFLNAFNNVNFYGTTCASASASCGVITSAYTDTSNTQDPGGRLIQLVLRINF
jgi:hypothetical protein